MSGNEKASPQDAIAQAQVAITDLRRRISPFFGGGFGDNKTTAFNKTAFDGFDLNAMVDMVEDALPADLEAAGDALEAAATKIEEVGSDLRTHIGNVTWQGQAGSAFRRWGGNLAKDTLKLGTYASAASVQIKAAGLGLAMVKASMPPRDDGGVGPKVAKIPEKERKGNNQDFVKAAKADATKREETRQEAIMQMNKLSSYYQVSHDTMYGQEEPTFKPLSGKEIGMPPAPPGFGDPKRVGSGGAGVYSVNSSGAAFAAASTGGGSGGGADFSGPNATPSSQLPGSVSPGVPASVPGSSLGPSPSSPALDSVTTPPVRTEIDSYAPPLTQADPGIKPPVPTGGGGPNVPPPPIGPIGIPGPAVPRPTGPGFAKNIGAPRNTGPLGGPSNGRTSPPPGPLMGRPPAGGGMPVHPPGRAGSPPPPMGRPPGIIGGTPSRSSPAANNAPRLPRGAVVGGEHPPMGRPPMGGMGMGMGGAGSPNPGRAVGNRGGRLVSTPGGVVGNPRSGAASQARTPRAFTPGGMGLVRGSDANSRNSIRTMPRGRTSTGRDPERRETRRRGYLTEDAETWSTRRGSSVPSVVE
ncbi:hypothetical protein LHJ74_33105 [Streptomyces sp. N2-109]|uniref:Uncharacterized protein n=1 Tax=Streptomyces gossypii TaxID=2883101 RepID=A0ABT2K3F5_9ACTN|nr:hypothetical protein [Streptomyces gossypii]MCT2594697.1 hypothetical protein [Streptomyces gossypii]